MGRDRHETGSKDKTGHRIGEVLEQSGRHVLVDKTGHRVGEYDPRTNVTSDRFGKRVGEGNLLAMLLRGVTGS